MKPIQARIASTVLALLAASPLACSEKETIVTNPSNEDRARAIDELNEAKAVVQQMVASKDIPLAQREATKCLVVVPRMGSGGFLIGGSFGRGVVTCRTAKAWSGPTFITLSGASAGLQIGGQSQDLLMLVKTDTAMNKLFTSSFQLGADTSVAAGPVGEGAQVAANVKGADILTYVRSKGLFAGVQVSGVWVKHDDAAIAGLYGPGSTNIRNTLAGVTPIPTEAVPFLQQVAMAFPAAAKGVASR
jgi:lipid-binding SYLF domain-containing protein